MQARFFTLFALSLLLFLALQAQAQPEPEKLQEVEVRANRNEVFSAGSRSSNADSLLLRLNPQASVSDLLRQISPVFIKNYGVSNLASVSVRGTTANQTALVWNGIQINSPANGINDLGLVPVFAGQSFRLTHGPMSALYGSGAVGGTLLLNSAPVPQKLHGLHFTQTIGSFGKLQSSFSGTYGGKKWQGRSSIQYSKAKNDFPFINEFSKNRQIERTTHAAIEQKHLAQDVYFFPTARLSISAHAWLLQSDRQIPPVMGVPVSLAEQEDRAARIAAIVRQQNKNGATTLRSAFLSDYILYLNPTIFIERPEPARAQTWLAEAERSFVLKNTTVNAGANLRLIRGKAKEFGKDVAQRQQAVFASVRHDFNAGTTVTLSGRKEFVTGFDPDPTFSLGAEQQLKENGSLGVKAQVANSFRVPTLNERYWWPGGNPDLEPERGLSAEAGFFWRAVKEKFVLKNAEVTLFNSVVEDMIVWRPVTGFVYSPQNLDKVWARGAELSAEAGKEIISGNRLTFTMRGAYSYTLSTLEGTKERAQQHKQLIYIPLHSASFFVSLQSKWANLRWQQSQTGKVFTSADNLNSLESYSLTDILIWPPEISFYKFNTQVTGAIRNVFDTTYQTVENTPMPGRYYEISLQIRIPTHSSKQ